jgi:peptidoglycan biosynthesis protein MviN/MurJ (putative lipid II flippase)
VGYIYGPLLTAGKIIFKMNLLYSLGVFLNIGLNLMLIPKLAENGAAMGTLITQTFIAFSQIYMSRRHLDLQNHFHIWIKLSTFFILLGGFTYALIFFNFTFYIHWAILWAFALTLGFLFRILQPLRFFSNFTIKN